MNLTSPLETLDDGFAWIESLTNFERKAVDKREYRLDRMRVILEILDNPQNSLRIVHIAGSKGKGSTATMIANQLHALGKRTALYTSPHVLDYRERIRMIGSGMPDSLLLQGIRLLKLETTSPGSPLQQSAPTTFELLTALFFWAAAAAKCEYAVVETGIGGRLDATNIAVSVEAAVCTSIELEHTDILGDTIEKIAAEKAGIIKPGCPVYIGSLPPAAEQIFQRRCTETGAPLHRLADNAAVNFDTGHIRFTDGCRIHPAMQVLGSIQLENAALAACVVRGIIPDAEIEAISEGLSATRMLGRMQLIPGVPPIVIDGAHTVDSIKRYLSAIRTVMPAGGTVIFGAVQGKNIPGMVEELTSVFSRAIVCRPGSFKPSNPEAIAAEFRRILPPESVTIVEDATAALEQAAEWTTDPGQGICIAGSFFLAGKILRAIQGIEATAEAV